MKANGMWGTFLACAAAVGCTAYHPFPVTELAYLDGYDIHNERSLTTTTAVPGTEYQPGSCTGVGGGIGGGMSCTPGRTVSTVTTRRDTELVTDRPYRVLDFDGTPWDFNSESALRLTLTDGTQVEGTFRRVEVTSDTFTGYWRGDPAGAPFAMPLAGIQTAEYVEDRSGTVLTATLVAAGLAAAIGLAFGLGFGLSEDSGDADWHVSGP